jgi:transposase
MSKRETKLIKKVEGWLKLANQREYLHHFGPKKYKLKHHLTALLVMQICKLSLRRVESFLILVGIEVPTYSALCKSRKKIPSKLWNLLLMKTSNLSSVNTAIDSTGFSRNNPSYHYVKRIVNKRPIKNFAKLSVFFDIEHRKFLALKVRIKPRHDVMDFKDLISKRGDIKILFGDSAYDAESIHEFCFDKQIQTMIKPRKNVKRGFYRKKQMKNYSEKIYHKRSLIESGFGSLKRKYGSSVYGKSFKSVNSEIYCKTICHNLNLTLT